VWETVSKPQEGMGGLVQPKFAWFWFRENRSVGGWHGRGIMCEQWNIMYLL